MELRDLGSTGLRVPVVGLGTWNVFNVKTDAGETQSERVVTAALNAGTTLFDTSPMYGEAERVLALSLAGRRERALVATKVWARTRAQGEQQIERALDWYERVDLYQVHNLLLYQDHLPYLQHLRDAGRVGAIGVTHYLPHEMHTIVQLMGTGDITCVQVPYNPLQRGIEDALLPAAADLGIGVIAMVPLKSGELMRRSPPAGALERLEPFGVKTWAQAVLKWSLSDPRVHAVIPATANVAHMAENAVAGRPPWFGPEERAFVQGLAESLG